jgi:magnesium-transporting ATPase (P-type)
MNGPLTPSTRALRGRFFAPDMSGEQNDPARWHSGDLAEILRSVESSPAGLASEEARVRLRTQGANTLPGKPAATVLRVFLKQFRSPLIYILFVALVLAGMQSAWRDAGVIASVILANALVGCYHERKAGRAVDALRKRRVCSARVVRGGREALVLSEELVRGDVLLLSPGDAVAADARLLEGVLLETAEAMLTGESTPVHKEAVCLPPGTRLADRRNMVFAGTFVTSGRGRAVVVATGAGTAIGRIARLTGEACEPPTPLEKRVAELGRGLLGGAACVFALVLFVGVARGMPMGELLMVAMSQMVSIVPEGLPVAITIALAVGGQRMARRGVIVRRLSAVETLGATTVICTDKTGTLTRNEMTVRSLWLPDGRSVSVQGSGYAPSGELLEGGARVAELDSGLRGLLEAGVLCNDAQLVPPRHVDGDWSLLGDPTEAALLTVALKAGMQPDVIRSQNPRLGEQPFDPATRLMWTLHRGSTGNLFGIIKGAPESVLPLCGGSGPLGKPGAPAAVNEMSSRGMRVLAVALVRGDLEPGCRDLKSIEGRAALLGVVGQMDPPREDARAAIASCKAAGIRLMMLTGDHPLAGLAIARELGIATEGDCAMDGSVLEAMDEAELRERLGSVAVFSRVEPSQKLRIVTALQACGEVVAMTGDGVNDAPALAQADVGVAMGKSGTDVAKDAASIVITDDRFSTIVSAVEQGRVVYGNLKKVILFLLVTSLDEILVLLLAMVSGFHSPLAAVQILWINIVTETTLTANLVLEPRDGRELSRPPVRAQSRLVDARMRRRILVLVPAAVVATLGWFVWRQASGGAQAATGSETFTVLAICQWFNALNCQSETRSVFKLGILENPWLLAGLGLSVLLQAAVLYVPALNSVFHTVPIPASTLAALAGVASLVLWLEEARKLLHRMRR